MVNAARRTQISVFWVSLAVFSVALTAAVGVGLWSGAAELDLPAQPAETSIAVDFPDIGASPEGTVE